MQLILQQQNIFLQLFWYSGLININFIKIVTTDDYTLLFEREQRLLLKKTQHCPSHDC